MNNLNPALQKRRRNFYALHNQSFSYINMNNVRLKQMIQAKVRKKDQFPVIKVYSKCDTIKYRRKSM